MADDFRERPWWGACPLDDGAAARWRLGPLAVYAARRQQEWRVVYETVGDWLDQSLEVARPCAVDELPDAPDAIRFGFLRAPDAIHLTPVLADRSVVLRPERTLLIPPGEGIDVYVSTPLWLRVSFGTPERPRKSPAGEGDGVAHEVPIYRPSDTWFGPSTIEGELCYASRTRAFLSLSEVQTYPHRARTVVHVKNRAVDVLRLERLNVPVRHLSLFAAEDRSLWTERVTLTRDEDGGLAAMRVSVGAPVEALGAVRVTEPRDRAETNVVVRAFEAFFKEKER